MIHAVSQSPVQKQTLVTDALKHARACARAARVRPGLSCEACADSKKQVRLGKCRVSLRSVAPGVKIQTTTQKRICARPDISPDSSLPHSLTLISLPPFFFLLSSYLPRP
eukprot:159407-Pleurochrysis_carterae.AAC.3